MGWMKTITPAARQKKWLELIRQQEQSKLSVSAFCREHGFSDQSSYNWRKRLAGSEPVLFALVEAHSSGSDPLAPLELMLDSGDRLRICVRH